MNTREIKFRVYNTKTKQWVHGLNYEVNLFGECILLGGFMNTIPVLELNDCVPLQYTGLKDSNGTEIYEGDIVKTIYNDEISVGAVMYHCELGAYRIQVKKQLLPIVTYRFVEGKPIGLITVADKVIGNIFDNPELLN